MECPECGGKVKTQIIPYYYRNRTLIGEFEAEICIKCGAKYFKEKSFIEIERIAKILKIWGRQITPIAIESTIATENNLPIISVHQLINPSRIDIEEKFTAEV